MSSLYRRAGQLFLDALARPTGERDAFLAEACGEDEELFREVSSLLMFHDEGTGGLSEGGGADRRQDFSAGDVFAGRYRMIARAGRGGMGDVWRADDLVLETPVALKLIHSATAADRFRILQEVRLARQITHPAVCRVFDVGEDGETVFFSMEFVKGEDLAALLRRTGRLTSERVLEIAHQLCAGLAAAHARGVLHRDLKPANILIDQDGLVRITDFGIAVTTANAAPQAIIGTPGYMAPEQFVPGAVLDERTDLYALGVVLFELLTGQPYHAAGAAGSVGARPSRLATGVHPALEGVILRALSPDRVRRPASALEMAADLPDIDAAQDGSARGRSWRGRHRPAWWAGLAVAVAIGAAGAVYLLRPAHALSARDTIVLADVRNTTNEPVFDGTLKVALAVALEQSPFLRVFPDNRMRDDLVLMQHEADEVITRALARQIAQRERFKALIDTSIASVGHNYVIALEAIDADTGDVMARQQVEAGSKEEVLTALGDAASRLRKGLGESLASIERFDVPLPRATTPSLEALHSYALALDEGRVLPRPEAIPHLQRAIELDPNFALALALLSGTYVNTGQVALAPSYARRAYELRDRVTERERYFISWRYYLDATEAWDSALDLARAWTAAYPREPFAFNSLGLAAFRLGRYEQAVEPYREAIRLDPKFVPPWQNLVATLTALNQYDAAEATIQDARAAGITYVGLRAVAYRLAFIQHDLATMAREFEGALADSQAPRASHWQPRVSAFEGRIATAHEEFRRSVVATTQAHQTELTAQYMAQDAESHAVVGQCADARREAAAAIEVSRDGLTIGRAARALAWCGEGAAAAALSGELARRLPDAILTTNVTVPVVAAATAISDEQATRALELLEPARPFEHSPEAEFWPAYLRGRAHLLLGDHSSAAGDFRSIVEHRGESPDAVLYPLAQLGLARALAMAGDAAARAAYTGFFALWEHADADLGPLKDARGEFARLKE